MAKDPLAPLCVPIANVEVEEGFNVRRSDTPGEGLVESIRGYGVRTPIRVRRKKGHPKLLIVDGHCRYQAALQVGLKQIPIFDYGFLTDDEALKASAQDNVYSRTWSKREFIDACGRFTQQKVGVSEIAQLLSIAKSTASEYVKISKLPPKLRAAAKKPRKEGGISTKTALKTANLTAEEQEQVAEELEGKTTEEAEEILNQVPSVQAAEPKRAPLPPKGYVSYSLVSDYLARCQKMENIVRERLTQKPSDMKLQGMQLAIGVLRGRLTVDEAFVDWGSI